MARERAWRGISKRLAIHYLTNLGGEQADDDTVVADDWRATLSSDKVGIGPTLQITEVTVRFEGDDDVLDPLIERFAQKAMRAGG
ncbi:hypothetical protein N6C22_17855 [Haloarchaeobius sp. HME9146]|nr:hypothetical protein [Haloarchaeobius sp. HME9146]MCT9097892.1 hypothetical protein [Haloarchaeobius sp. HME9146]